MLNNNTGEGGFQWLWKRVLSIFDKGRDEVIKSSRVGKARLELSSLKRERERVFERLGEEVYRRYKEKAASIPGIESFFTEIDIISLKLSSKERELKGPKGEEAVSIPEDAAGAHEKKEKHHGPRRKGAYRSQVTTSPMAGDEGKVEVESDRRPRKKYYRPRRRPFEVRQDVVKVESNNKGL